MNDGPHAKREPPLDAIDGWPIGRDRPIEGGLDSRNMRNKAIVFCVLPRTRPHGSPPHPT
jgi:hypothetical protein